MLTDQSFFSIFPTAVQDGSYFTPNAVSTRQSDAGQSLNMVVMMFWWGLAVLVALIPLAIIIGIVGIICFLADSLLSVAISPSSTCRAAVGVRSASSPRSADWLERAVVL